MISRMGSMFFGDPIAAFSNLHRALRPEGRLTLLTWQGVADNEWLTEFRAALAVGRDLPTPPPDAPSPFALADPDRVKAILDAAGFADISFESLHDPMSFGPDPDDAFEFVSDLTGWMRDGLDEAEPRRCPRLLASDDRRAHRRPRGHLPIRDVDHPGARVLTDGPRLRRRPTMPTATAPAERSPVQQGLLESALRDSNPHQIRPSRGIGWRHTQGTESGRWPYLG